MPFVLASASPRRRELLAMAGFVFDVDAVEIDETPRVAESATDYVERLAREKAEAVARRHPGRVVLGADTTVVVTRQILGKPADATEVGRMLRLLSGRSHEVFTGVAVVREGQSRARVARTVVWMSEWSDEDIATYIGTGEPFDKAGAYAIQGYAARFIPRIDGSYSNVVGLPIALVHDLMKGHEG